MAIYRQVQINFWQDDFVVELTPEERYFYIYIMTNPRTTQCGIFKLVKKFVAFELGYDRETVDKLLKKFDDYGKIHFCEETKEIMVINWMKYNFINSKNTILCINKELKEVKNKEFIKCLYAICLEKNYAVNDIFRGIEIDAADSLKETKVIPLKIGNEDIKNSNFTAKGENSSEEDKEGLASPSEAPYKALGEEEIKKEIYKNKSSNNQKVLDKNINGEAEKSISRILFEFNKNIKKASILEIERFKLWRTEFEEEVIIKAIEQAVKYKVKHIGYIEGIIRGWREEGITTMEELTKKLDKTKGRVNFAAYKYVD